MCAARTGRMIPRMTPEDLTAVQRSWAQLSLLIAPLHAELTRRFEAAEPSAIPAATRAEWLLSAVGELVGLLAAPSRLADRACVLGETWPDPCTAPSFAVEGRAWLGAARRCLPTWSPATEAAWRQAWLLLSDVLAAETLSPFTDDPAPDRRPPSR